MKMLPSPKTRRKTRPQGRGKRDSGPRRDPVTGQLFGGNPGNRGGGRLTNEFKEFLATEILGSPQMRQNLQAIVAVDITQIHNPALAIRAAKLMIDLAAWAADRVEGRAMQPLRSDPMETERVAALREMTNEELIAALKTVDSEITH